MNLEMGSQTFDNVDIPLLWGTRAVVQDRDGYLSVIDLGGTKARLEVLADKPAPKSRFKPSFDGFAILNRSGEELYSYSPVERKLTSLSLGLPDCQIQANVIKVGNSIFSGNAVSGSGVGIAVTDKSISMGAPLPPGLAKLVV